MISENLMPGMKNMKARAKTKEGKVWIEGLDKFRVDEPLFEAVRIVLNYKGEDYSTAYIQGVSGAAFRLAGPCPCAPTSSFAMSTEELIKLLGYDAQTLSEKPPPFDSFQGWEDPEWISANTKRIEQAIPLIKNQIKLGNPVIVWGAFDVCEYNVVCGFEEKTKKFLGRGGSAGLDGYAIQDEHYATTSISICGYGKEYAVGEKIREFSADKAEISALEEALRHARDAQNQIYDYGESVTWKMQQGSNVYNWWIHKFGLQELKMPDMGDTYCLGVYRTTHQTASTFLLEIACKYPEAEKKLVQAAQCFNNEAQALNRIHTIFVPSGQVIKTTSSEINTQVVELFKEAKHYYDQGIIQISRALTSIESED
jgi:hypothetical protein